jgi:hypothetical protein
MVYSYLNSKEPQAKQDMHRRTKQTTAGFEVKEGKGRV